jgi:hypothetical protein
LIRQVLAIVKPLNQKWLDVRFTSEQNGTNLEYNIFNTKEPYRWVFFEYDNWVIKLTFEDKRLSEDEMVEELSEIEEYDYSSIEKWLKWESMISTVK